MIFILLVIALIVTILVRVYRECRCCSGLVMMVYDKVFFGMIFKSIMFMFLPLLIRSGLGKNLCTTQCVEIETNYYVIVLLTLYLSFVFLFSQYVHPTQLASEVTTKRMGALYKSLKYHDQHSMNYWWLFYLKRMLYVIIWHISVVNSLRIELLIIL